MKLIDYLLDKVTMYRLVLYYLIGLLLAAVGLSALGVTNYKVSSIVISAVWLTVVCGITNKTFSWAFNAPLNYESSYITALILALIISPALSKEDYIFMAVAGMLAMASKYIIAYRSKHIFNPAAIAVALTALIALQSPSWWVGSKAMLPFVLIGGLLLTRKIRRFSMVLTFLASALVSVVFFSFIDSADHNMTLVLQRTLLSSSLFFLAFVMLTEPLTSPQRYKNQFVYALIAGAIFSPHFHVFGIYSTPELALVIANVFAYTVSPKFRLNLEFIKKEQITRDSFNLYFNSNARLSYEPGQYMEWTLPHNNQDSRGNRRYFTLASSPTEKEIIIGVKFNPNSSSYKKTMIKMATGTKIAAGLLGGDFILPSDKTKPVVLIAGGIGITPYRSMIKYMIDKSEQRPLSLIYSASTVKDFAYTGLLSQAKSKLGTKVIYNITDISNLPANWNGSSGYLTEKTILSAANDIKDCTFYISGPNVMVNDIKKLLKSMHVRPSSIKTDLFSGYN